MRRWLIIVCLGLAALAGGVTGHFTTIYGWDGGAVGTNNAYCYVYFPHADIGCEHAA